MNTNNRTKRIFAILLTLVMILTMIPATVFAENSTAQDKLTTEVDGLTFEVEGTFSQDAELEVVPLESDVNEYIHNDILDLPELTEGLTGVSYDIKIMENGEEIQPTDEVVVTVKDDSTTAETKVAVFHMPDTSADDIYAAYMQNAGIQTFSRMTTEAKEITGETIENVTVGDGYYQFATGGFSVYYVVAGKTTNNNGTDVGDLPGEDSTYYVEPGTEISFHSGTFSGNGTTGITRNNRTIIVAENAEIGTTAVFRVTVNGWFGQTSTYNLTFVVSSRDDVIDGAIATQTVILCIRDDGVIPGEPGVSTGATYYHVDANYNVRAWSGYFSTNATDVIDPSIKGVLEPSIDGTSTAGAYDATGGLKEYITGPDWEDRMLDAAIEAEAKATDGTPITNTNRNNYTVIPYVVKLMAEGGIGWHIDCAVVPASRVTLSYDLNLKNYIVSDNTLTVPAAVTRTGVGLFTEQADYIKVDGQNLEVDDPLNATLNGEPCELEFLGWSTDPNATVAEYAPNATIEFSEDTVLYAVWSGRKDIRITYMVAEPTAGGRVGLGDVAGTQIVVSETLGVETGTAKGATAAANDGYNFTGWYSDAACQNRVSTDLQYTPAKNSDGENVAATYYAKFVENEVTIKYEAVGGGTVTPGKETLGVVTGDAQGSTATANENYEFVGWYDNSECTGNALSKEAKYVPEKVDGKNVAATYYAKFVEQKATINYVPVGGGTVDKSTETVNKVTGTAAGSAPTANAGYEFAGWYTDQDCKNRVDADLVEANNKLVPAKAADAAWPDTTTYYAKFVELESTINYVVKDNKGGTVTPASETIGMATGTAAGSKAEAAEGYAFAGWYNNPECTGTPLSTSATYKPVKSGETWPATSTYYAKFVELNSEIYYEVEGDIGGTVSIDKENLPMATGTAVGSTATAAEGYNFVGWFDSKGNEVSNNVNLKPQKPGTTWPDKTTYYARFAEQKVTLTYVAVGPEDATDFGSVSPASEEVNRVTGTAQGSTATANAPTFKFVGWYDNPECTGTALSTDVKYVPAKPDGLWEAKTYYAKFDWNLANLIISKNYNDTDLAIDHDKPNSSTESGEESQSAIFVVTGTMANGQKYEQTVVIHGESSVTIENLIVGNTYTVTEQTDWSWRYTPADAEQTVTINPPTVVTKVEFDNTRTNQFWLNGGAFNINNFAIND